MALICATGPLLFSVSLRQVISEHQGNHSTVLGLRYAGDPPTLYSSYIPSTPNISNLR